MQRMEIRWRVWVRDAPDKWWYQPVRDAGSGDFWSWETAEDAEDHAEPIRMRERRLGNGRSRPKGRQVVVLPDGDQP